MSKNHGRQVIYLKEIYQIVNISDLEKKIQSARLDTINLLLRTKEKQLNHEETVELLENLKNKLYECENFDFILEKRTIKE